MELRDDVTFHDGSKLTAEDVKFSLRTAAASSFSSSIFAWYDAENTTVVNDSTIELETGRTNNMASLVFNNSYELFSDIRVHQALAYALDLNSLVQVCWEGTAEVAEGYYASSMLGFKKEGPREYNPEKAKQLLAEAGYPNGFEFTYTTYQTSLNQNFAEVLQNMWAQVGVTAKIDIVDLTTVSFQ